MLFFTLMVVLNKIGIDSTIINTVLIWFISMLTIAWWLAFGLWGKDIAKEILESFRK
jgi:RimJ/RimL family protein N-acetyltransferase